MWSSSQNEHLKKGFVLPLTLILLTFGSIMIFIAGIHVSRTTDKIQSYNIIANQKNVASNVIEVATYHYFENPSTSFDATWNGIEAFKNYVTNRGGVEGAYWKEVLADADIDKYKQCIKITDIENYKSLAGFGEGKYEISAYVYPIGEKRIVIGVVGINNRKRYAIGLLSNIARPSTDLPAIRTGQLDRVLTKMRSVGKGNNKDVKGDLVYGNAILLDDILVDLTDSSTPGELIYPELQAFSVNVSQEILDDYPNWFSATTTVDDSEKDMIFDSWKNDHLETLPEASVTAYMNNKNTWPSTFDGDTLYIIDATNTTEPSYYIDFDDNGIHITQTDEYGSLIGNTLTIPSDTALSSKIHLQFNGDVIIGDDSHKISTVTGKYSLTVYGNISIESNPVYSNMVSIVNNSNNPDNIKNKVANQPLKLTKAMITDMKENSNDDLDLVSIGGDVVMKYLVGLEGKATHGIKFISGDVMAFKENGEGGNIYFSDFQEVINKGIPSQFFVFGSITANTFDASNTTSDELDSLILVANSQSENGSGSTTSELQLVGMRTW